MHKAELSNLLSPFLPEGTALYLAELIDKYEVDFTISKPRKTKLGDYRYPQNGEPHKISVNGNLNKYAFLLTSVHEFAHLTAFENYGPRIPAHGKEWKHEFNILFNPLLKMNIFPFDVTEALSNYMDNVKASSHSDERLLRVLRRYDEKKMPLVETLEIGQKFKLNGKNFVKGKKLRKYHICSEIESGRKFRVLGLAEIEKL